uniref:Uncharacterized protein n=1 Tax=Plectus sambesii TaxID=2011161 RepID=A0A914UMY8_9BILA
MTYLKLLIVATLLLAVVSAQRSCRSDRDCPRDWDCHDHRCHDHDNHRDRHNHHDHDNHRDRDNHHDHDNHRDRNNHRRGPRDDNIEEGQGQQQLACIPACGNRQICDAGRCQQL